MSQTNVPTPEALVERARALIPALRERADAADLERRLPTATVEDFRKAGFFNILKPKRWGGYEMDPQVFFDVQMAIAEGDMSSAWVLGVVGVHNFQLGLFDERAQIDVWGKDPEVLISSSYQPVGKVQRVEGGFTLSGRWSFSSGSEHCQWIFLGSLVPPAEAGGPPDMRTFLLSRDQYRIDDKWHTFGLKATGSQDIVVESAFIPEYRTHRAVDGFKITNPGLAVNNSPLFHLPWAQIFVRSVSTASIGAAQGALNTFLKIAAERVSSNTGKAAKADPLVLTTAARVQSELDKLRLVLKSNFDRMMTLMRQGKEIPMTDRVRYRYDSATVSRACADLVDDLMPLLGGRAIYTSSPMTRYWLDLNAGRAHVANDPNAIGSSVGMLYLGQEVQEFFV